MAIITLATDYGNQDGFNSILIGVIKSLSPRVEVIEVTNGLSSVLKASIVLWRYYSHYPIGTVHLVVIDPSVGTDRRALIGTDGRYLFTGPDNGVFTKILDDSSNSTWYEIDTLKLPVYQNSYTFHGRDIFAPAAAMLSMGKAPDILGKLIINPVKIDIPRLVETANFIKGEIIDVDSFGNLIINIPGDRIGNRARVTLKTQTISLKYTYADVSPGQPVAYIGSLGLLEVAVNKGRADKYFKARIGTKVKVIP